MCGFIYNGNTILSRINKDYKLSLLEKDQELSGYVYVEADAQHHDGSIEYIAVAEHARGRGIGSTLLSHAVQYLFEQYGVQDFSLCVSSDNQAAIHMYHKAGFQDVHHLVHYAITPSL